MDLVKKYPWADKLQVSQQQLDKWILSGTKDSFVFWSLENQIISRKIYFDWAVEYYQIPLLREIFFDQKIMKKREWKEIRHLFNWNKDMMPIAVWDGIIFIGCVELSKKHDFDFKHRFVLTTDLSLNLVWKFVNQLSKSVQEQEEKTKIRGETLTCFKTQVGTLTETEELTKGIKGLKTEKKDQLKQSFTSDIPTKKEAPLKPQLSVVNTKLDMLTSEDSFPEQETDRGVDVENNTFPGRYIEEDQGLVMQTGAKNKMMAVKDLTNIKGDGDTEGIMVTGLGLMKMEKEICYDALWSQTKPYFCTSLILKVEEEKLYPYTWTGCISLKNQQQELISFQEYSLFKIVKKGQSYNGFVVDTVSNKKFFKKIGWDNYPKHVTANPIRNDSQEIEKVFVGLSTNCLTRNQVKETQEIVYNFFNSEKLIKKAA